MGAETKPVVSTSFCPNQVNVRLVVRSVAFAEESDSDEQLPRAGRQRAGQIRGRCVRNADTEFVLVTTAPAAKALRIEQAEIECGVVFAAGVSERHVQPLDAGRHFKRNSDVAVCLLMADGPVKVEVLGQEIRTTSTKQETEGKKENEADAASTGEPSRPFSQGRRIWIAVGSSVTGGGAQGK